MTVETGFLALAGSEVVHPPANEGAAGDMKVFVVLLVVAAAVVIGINFVQKPDGGEPAVEAVPGPETAPPPSAFDKLQKAEVLMAAGQLGDAEARAQEGLQIARKDPAGSKTELAPLARLLSQLFLKTARAAEAETLLKEVATTIEKASEPNPSGLALVQAQLADVYYRSGRGAEVEKQLEKAAGTLSSGKVEAQDVAAFVRFQQARLYHDQKREDEAIKILEPLLEAMQPQFASFPEEISQGMDVLGRAYLAQGKTQQAEALYKRAAGLMESGPKIESATKGKVYQGYAETLRALKNAPEADKWSAKAIALGVK